MTLTVTAVIARVILSVWLIYVATADLRTLEVPNWATVPPLLAATLWRSATPGGYPIALALALFLTGAQWPVVVPVTVAAMATVCTWLAVPVGLEVAVGAWVLCAVLWHLGIIGGADIRVVMTLLTLFPDGRLAWLLMLAWFGHAVVYLALCRRGITRALLRAGKELLRLRVNPENQGHPLLPAVALAGLAYLWFYL